jgi:ribosomal protein S18 acetylase RimI-like enzyme
VVDPGAVAPVIHAAGPGDLPGVLALWRQAEAEPGHTDNIASLQRLVAHDPGALLVAETANRIVGSVIAGWDGWRGTVYRLAVAPDLRRRGLGRLLVSEAERRLATLGAVRLQAIIVESDPRATGFWRASGWTEQTERLRFTNG